MYALLGFPAASITTTLTGTTETFALSTSPETTVYVPVYKPPVALVNAPKALPLIVIAPAV